MQATEECSQPLDLFTPLLRQATRCKERDRKQTQVRKSGFRNDWRLPHDAGLLRQVRRHSGWRVRSHIKEDYYEREEFAAKISVRDSNVVPERLA